MGERDAGATRPRDSTVDALRGFAVATMVAANLASLVLPEPHPFWLRLYGSFAAPTFVLLSGMMVSLTWRRHGPGYFAARGATLIALGVLVDLAIWQIVPFTGVDILYLIGLSLPAARLLEPAAALVRWGAPVAVLALAPLLRWRLGYTSYPTEIDLWWSATVTPVPGQTGILNHWLVDGWFPVFPWLGFSLLGGCLGRVRSARGFPQPGLTVLGAGVLAVGVGVWWLRPGPLLTRSGSTEMFYPPTTAYVITAVGFLLTLFAADRFSSARALDLLRALGESSLAMYLLHLVLIRYAVSPVWPRLTVAGFGLAYAATVAAMISGAYGLRRLKQRHPPRAFLATVLLGG
jgi:uncharacterized membrane protein